jgi:hypothetical protein
MLFMQMFEEIMRGYNCSLNTAMQMYQKGTVWED